MFRVKNKYNSDGLFIVQNLARKTTLKETTELHLFPDVYDKGSKRIKRVLIFFPKLSELCIQSARLEKEKIADRHEFENSLKQTD